MEEFLQVRMAAGSPPGTDPSNPHAIAKSGGKGGGGGGADTPATDGAPREGGPQGSSGDGGRGGGGAATGETPLQDLSKNWFSAENTLRVYGEVRVWR